MAYDVTTIVQAVETHDHSIILMLPVAYLGMTKTLNELVLTGHRFTLDTLCEGALPPVVAQKLARQSTVTIVFVGDEVRGDLEVTIGVRTHE